MSVSFEVFRDDCIKEFFKNYDEIKDKLQALLTSEYNNKDYNSDSLVSSVKRIIHNLFCILKMNISIY